MTTTDKLHEAAKLALGKGVILLRPYGYLVNMVEDVNGTRYQVQKITTFAELDQAVGNPLLERVKEAIDELHHEIQMAHT